MQKGSNKITVTQIIVFGISFGLAYFATNYFFFNKKELPNDMLINVAKEMNASMPKMIDAETRLDSTSVENSTLNYHYTLINIDKDNANWNFDDIKSNMIIKAQENLDHNPSMKDYRENGVALHYIFNDKNQNELFSYTVKHQKPN
ncbi:hypothetical protein [Flavobacterium sp.]|uniref:hypothetical protein n=1 Tax=Flavobacterium sp. TaxID=239 RepID=UPI00262FB7F9|nr:hypothetical protein [Flavobacterium sp.]MDD3004213.1 hypothetical protein [Flavobacterium sp.]